MDKIKKNFGFGLMRLPMKGEEVNIERRLSGHNDCSLRHEQHGADEG